MSNARLLRELIQQEQTLVAPGVFDGLSALLAKQAGFSVLYASGGAIARSMGYPDIGLVTMTEVLRSLERIVDASQLPVIADADTGFGSTLNVVRTIREYERVGVAGLHIEDQTFPKRCGHLNDKSIVSMDEMLAKIVAAKQAKRDPDFMIIARTDAIAVEGLEAAIQRGQSYLKAGADMVFIEAPETVEQIHEIAKRISGPKLINMFSGGKTPVVPVDTLKSLGYNLVIVPSDLQRAAITGMKKNLSVLREHGNSASIEAELTTFKERELIIETARYFEADRRINEEAAAIQK